MSQSPPPKESKQPSEEQPAPEEGQDEQAIVLLEIKPAENLGLKVNKDLQVMQVVKTGPSDGKFLVGDIITHVSYIWMIANVLIVHF